MSQNLRLKEIRKKRLTPQEIATAYTQWVSEDDVLIFKKDSEIWGHKASKRGNDVYTDHINYKFRNMKRATKQKGISLYGAVQETKSDFLFITLTTRQDETIDEAWLNIGKKFNQFRSNLIRRFGKVEFMRTWESHKKGYPHIHALVKFQQHEFNVFKGWKNNKQHWLVQNHFKIKECWKHGFSDVSACTSVREGLSYVGKYIIKNAVKENPSENLTLALSWYFGKRAFSVSGNFFAVLLSGLCNSNRITNPNVIFLGCFARSFVYGFVLNKKQIDRGAWDNELSFEILDHLPKYDEIIRQEFNKKNGITDSRQGSYGLGGLRKASNFLEEESMFDYGADIEYTEIETNNGKYTEKVKFIIADMECDEIGFSSAPQFMMGREKIKKFFVKMGQAQSKIIVYQVLMGSNIPDTNCKSTQATLINQNCFEWGFTFHTLKEFVSTENSIIEIF